MKQKANTRQLRVMASLSRKSEVLSPTAGLSCPSVDQLPTICQPVGINKQLNSSSSTVQNPLHVEPAPICKSADSSLQIHLPLMPS